MSVSMVAVAWRALTNAALWNGHAPQVTTGAASARTSHCQLGNCNAGIIDSATTGTDRIALPISRSLSGSFSAFSSCTGAGGAAV
jgi:hypothetical protein